MAPAEGSPNGALEAPPPDHETEERARSRAKLCALFSLSVGTTIYVAWRFTHLDWLIPAGMLWLGVGTLLTLGGFVFLRDCRKPIRGTVLLLLLNFPVATLCTWSAIDVFTRIEVVVVNTSGETLRNVKLTCAELVIELPDLPPGRGVARVVRPRGDGDLRLDYTAAGPVVWGTILIGYVSNNSGGYVQATVGPGPALVTISTTRPPLRWPILP